MSIEALAEVLETLGGRAFLTPEAGAFQARVMDHLAVQLDELCDDPEELIFDVEVQLVSDPDPRNISVSVRAASADFETTMQLCAYQLNKKELRFLVNALLAEKRKQEVPSVAPKPKVIIRKKSDNSYDLHTAAQKLDVSTDWFKKTIPCTGYKGEELEDGNTVHHFRYQKEIVDRLCKVRDHSADVADLQYLADACCEGDLDWAQDIAESLKRKRGTAS